MICDSNMTYPINIAGMRKGGRTIATVKIDAMRPAMHVVEDRIEVLSEESIVAMSLLKRLSILPVGVVSNLRNDANQ